MGFIKEAGGDGALASGEALIRSQSPSYFAAEPERSASWVVGGGVTQGTLLDAGGMGDGSDCFRGAQRVGGAGLRPQRVCARETVTAPVSRFCRCSRVTGEDTEAERGQGAGPRSCSG